MKKESPIYVVDLCFCSISSEEKNKYLTKLRELTFDGRHEFLIDPTFAGIAVEIEFCNSRYYSTSPKGVRRKVSLALIDATTRCEAAIKPVKVNIRKDTAYTTVHTVFSTDEVSYRAAHTYRLVVRDDATGEVLEEQFIHMFSQSELGHPSEWYTLSTGGIRPDWEDNLYRSLKVPEHSNLNVRFTLGQNFGLHRPSILPELELRLYYPDDDRIKARFVEPKCIGQETDLYFVELPFRSSTLYSGVFYAEIICMEYLLGGFVFNISGPEIKGEWFGEDLKPLDEYSTERAKARFNLLVPSDDDANNGDEFDAALDRFIADERDDLFGRQDDENGKVEGTDVTPSSDVIRETDSISLLDSFDHLTGLRAVKEKLTIYERVVRFNKMRTDKGLPVSSTPLHAMFLGSPGTGKTTMAKMMGMMLHRAGILSKGHVVVRERATLLGQNYNSESEKTLAAIEEARGGILLIDEAYQLYQPNDSRDPGKFVIETLLTELADESNRDWMLVLAGYPQEMKRMFDMNPGFKSRIPDSNIYVFDDFTESELMEIAEKYFSRHQYSLTPDACAALENRLKADYSRREKNFGNARHVINMIQTEILPAMAVRVTSGEIINEVSLTQILPADIPMPDQKQALPCRRIGFI